MSITDVNIAWIRRHMDAMPGVVAPAESYKQDLCDATTVLAGVPDTWVTARSVVVPAQKRAVVRYLAIDSNTVAAGVFIRFRFTVNGQPTLAYQSPPFIFGDLTHPSEIWFDVSQQNTLALQLRNLDMTTGYLVMTRMVLWTWDINPPIVAKDEAGRMIGMR